MTLLVSLRESGEVNIQQNQNAKKSHESTVNVSFASANKLNIQNVVFHALITKYEEPGGVKVKAVWLKIERKKENKKEFF